MIWFYYFIIIVLLCPNTRIVATSSIANQLAAAAAAAATDGNIGGINNKSCFHMEKQALLHFKASLQDPNGQLSTWIPEDDDCCKWNGVTCNNQTHHVTRLHLSTDLDVALVGLGGFGVPFQGFSLFGPVATGYVGKDGGVAGLRSIAPNVVSSTRNEGQVSSLVIDVDVDVDVEDGGSL
ncbi:hypothetical protein L6452_24077 [Arctium lappa]|uniref:Uncharacterized protein n=1 Tax=Arctium lappa TaxID=4217 RepID=A0ACB9A9E0_ARCLA|nr:hypothetical protein L6452_24077 [Arctium lappa]